MQRLNRTKGIREITKNVDSTQDNNWKFNSERISNIQILFRGRSYHLLATRYISDKLPVSKISVKKR